jgi:hypothetical protein
MVNMMTAYDVLKTKVAAKEFSINNYDLLVAV